MAEDVFTLANRDEVIRFQELADSYAVTRTRYALPHLSLPAIYDHCQSRADGGKVFAALLDVFINFLMLYCDTHMVSATWNSKFSKGKLEGGSILDSAEKFHGKMDVHRYNSSFVLRYRALWDKLLGAILLLYEPLRYESFISSKSRRKSFKKIAARSKIIPADMVDSVEMILDDFDREFRTPEEHGTGALRKWSFKMESMHENPQIKLTGYWNVMVNMMVWLGGGFKPRGQVT